MIRFCPLASGSSGNCLYLETDHTKALIDAGFSGRQIESLLWEIGVDPGSLDYIFVTHEHLDHIKGVGVLARRYRIPIAANFATWNAMHKTVGKLPHDLMMVFDTGSDFTVRDLDVHPFAISHDAADPVGYVFYHKEKKISVLTDTGVVTEPMIERIRHSDILFVEANHDPDMLERGSYPLHLKSRIRSARGHLSNEECGTALPKILKANGEIVFLGHLSQENNVPLLAMDTVTSVLDAYGLRAQKDIRLLPAKRYGHSDIIQF